jgi:hypothetical protein
MVKTSLIAAMLMTTGAYAAQITGADVGGAVPYVDWEPYTQFGFDGLNMDNVNVNLITADGNPAIVGEFNPATGEYPNMTLGDTYQSSVFAPDDNKSDEATRLGYITQKIWPISEPMGLKVVNNDPDVKNGKPENCIMASSYLGDSNTSDADDTTFYLEDTTPKPTLCSSYAGSSKRFQLVLNENVVKDYNVTTRYGKPVDLVFNIDSATGNHRYQVFQKVSNFTGMRLDGFKIEVLNSAGVAQTSDLNISLGFGEALDKDGNPDGDLWPSYELAFYPPGLWGDGSKKHLEEGWFDLDPSGYEVSGHGTNTIISGDPLPDGNYIELFGNWQPEKWVPIGMHEVIDPLAEPILIAYWGIAPGEDFNATPDWHYGQADGFATPSDDTLAMWAADPEKYVIDDIEDIPNVSMNYIVNVGEAIDTNFTIRITPKVSIDQTPPSYISKEDNSTYIMPPEVTPVTPTTPTATTTGGGGGGCTYNPDSKHFDMMFLVMMAMGLLYPFRRRFIK